jgi:hypothetical protein
MICHDTAGGCCYTTGAAGARSVRAELSFQFRSKSIACFHHTNVFLFHYFFYIFFIFYFGSHIVF